MRLATNDCPAPAMTDTREEAIRVFVCRTLDEAKARLPCFEKSAIGALYSTFEWASAWQASVGAERDVEPFVLVLEDTQGPLLVLHLGIERKGPFRIARFLGHGHGNQNTGLWRPESLKTVETESLRKRIAETAKAYGVDLLDLRNLPLTLDRFQNPLLTAEDRPSHAPLFSFVLSRDFDTLYKARRSTSARKKLNAKERRLQDAGAFRFSRAEDERTALSWLDTLFTQRSARAQSAGVPNAFADASIQTFLRNMLLGALNDGSDRFMIHAIEVGGAVRATYLGGIRDRRYFAYANSLAEDELTVHSPGDVLLVHLIREACSKDCTIFDFGLGEERYKTAWAVEEPLADILEPLTVGGKMLSLALGAWVSTKREIRQSPLLWPMVRKARAIRLRRSG